MAAGRPSDESDAGGRAMPKRSSPEPKPANRAAGRADPADAPAPDAAQPGGHAGHGAGGDRRDVLRRHPRHHAACRHRPGVPHGHADADAVGRRHGGRRLLRHQPRARRGRRSARRGAGPARHRHRCRGRIGVLCSVRRLRARHLPRRSAAAAPCSITRSPTQTWRWRARC